MLTSSVYQYIVYGTDKLTLGKGHWLSSRTALAGQRGQQNESAKEAN